MGNIVGSCPKCGAPIYSYNGVWLGITPPPVTHTCTCNQQLNHYITITEISNNTGIGEMGGIMSGGAYDYQSLAIKEFAKQIELKGKPEYRKTFKKMLLAMADVCYAIEWEDSGDLSEKETKKAFTKMLKKFHQIAINQKVRIK